MMAYKKICFLTLGCKLNFSETSYISKLCSGESYRKVGFYDSPDIYVINTCAVTEKAVKDCKSLVRKAKQHHPEALVAVVGCYAQLKGEELANMLGVDLVLGTAEKFELFSYIEKAGQASKEKQERIHVAKIGAINTFFPSYSYGDRTRSFLKIQDGCDYPCSYCTIPIARGRSRSHSIAETVKVAQELALTEVKEVVLTGVNIGDFGKNLSATSSKQNRKHRENFYGLLQALDKIKQIERFRISSIEPNLLTDETIEWISISERMAPHLHIPLQSGANNILKAMRRKYKRELFADRVMKIKQCMPHACIGADVIVGFPGETEEDFLETYHFLEQLPVSYLHVFSYSARENTEASLMKEIVSPTIKAERSKKLHHLSQEKRNTFYEENRGKEVKVLFESKNNNGCMYGFSENYIKVKTRYTPQLINQIQHLFLNKLDTDGVFVF